MNKCIFQLWEQSNIRQGIIPDGCSIHIDDNHHNRFISDVYSIRDDNAPKEYERIVGEKIECFVSDMIFQKLIDSKNLRLSETEKNNLILLEDIIFKTHEIF